MNDSTVIIFAQRRSNGEVRIVVNKKNKLRSREERGGNVVSIEAYDNTSRAYKRETPRRPQTPFSIYLTLALWVFLLIFLFSLLFNFSFILVQGHSEKGVQILILA